MVSRTTPRVAFKTRRARRGVMLSWSDWEDWLLVERDLKPSYVRLLRRRVDALSGLGVEWGRFARGPMEARSEVAGVLADLKRRGAVNMLRSVQKALNHVAAYLADRDVAFAGLRWDLAREPRRRLEPYVPDEVRRIASSVGPGFKGARQAAMVWLLSNACWRRNELRGLLVSDWDAMRCGFVLRDALKWGTPGFVILPRSALRDDYPLQRYLAARAGVARGPALWVTMHGAAITAGGWGSDMHDLRVRSGVAANFNRFKHTRNTIFEESGTPLATAQRENRHTDPKWTMWYMHGSIDRRRATLRAHKVPGFEDEPVTAPVSEVWRDLGLPDKQGEVDS